MDPKTKSQLRSGTKIGEFNHVYISVKTTVGYDYGYVNRRSLSGRYEYHSTKYGSDIFVQPAGKNALEGEQFFLTYRDGFWYITNEEYAFYTREPVGREPNFGAFLRLKTTGTSNTTVTQNSIFRTFEIRITALVRCGNYVHKTKYLSQTKKGENIP